MGFSEKNLWEKRSISREFREKIRDKFRRKQSLKKSNFAEIFWANVSRKRSVLRWFHERFYRNKTEILPVVIVVVLFRGGGGEEWWALACATTTTTGTSTTHKCCLFKTGYFVLKTPACFAISFALGIVSHKIFFYFYQRSSFALLTTMSLEMRQWQSFLYHALATGQCPVFRNNNLRTPGSFGSFSCCSDEVSK